MRILYIGHYNLGSTSQMRGQYLQEILNPSEFYPINIDVPLNETNRILRSVGWRYKIGPLINNINNYIRQNIPGGAFDIVWVDKGVFIEPKIISMLRGRCKKLIHFTPDPAFTYHKSNLFYESLPQYDYCITSKSFELDYYKKYGAKNILLCTQGYDPKIHKPHHTFNEKTGVVFVGHKEANREEIISKLLEAKVFVKLAGIKWEGFVRKHRGNVNLEYAGKGIFGEEYARFISSAFIGLGFLSKIIPELHTTRTFEIPACGTALITEKNNETGKIFSQHEVLFFSDVKELVEKVQDALKDKGQLQNLAEKGMRKVREGGYDYKSILQNIIAEISL